jgi:hypothetical protein
LRDARARSHRRDRAGTHAEPLTLEELVLLALLTRRALEPSRAQPYPAPQRCAVTSAPAKYIDPHTGCAYATLEAFRTLRGRTGRRQHSFSGAPATPAGGAADE